MSARTFFISMIAAACTAATFTSCASTQGSRNQALATMTSFTTKAPKVHRDRVKGGQILSVNGKAASDQLARVRPGHNDVRVRFKWPQGGYSREISLKFSAVENRNYFLRLDPFPPTADQFRGMQAGVESVRLGAGLAERAPILAIPVVVAAIPFAGGEGMCRTIDTIREWREPAQHVDLFVISDNMAEGVVRRVRAYPDGSVDWKTWDAWSSAPASGRAPFGGTEIRNRQVVDDEEAALQVGR